MHLPELSEASRPVCFLEDGNNLVSKSCLLMMWAFICHDKREQVACSNCFPQVYGDGGALVHGAPAITNEALGPPTRLYNEDACNCFHEP